MPRSRVEAELPTARVRRFLVPTERGDSSLTWEGTDEPEPRVLSTQAEVEQYLEELYG